ncbi:MAG: hypothetical protein V1735_02040 [Nanoarchaeota archaeon]
MAFHQFVKELEGGRVEGILLQTAILSLITSFIILGVLYALVLRSIDNFIGRYGLPLLLAAVSTALLMPAVKQVRTYRKLACMPGMMVGMIIGMISGFLAGYAVGMTNGMFIGSLWGMAVGISLGVLTGLCCGVMGLLEGIMAGFMSGLMGAMTAVMLLNDHVVAMGIIIFGISSAIILGLNYMMFTEMRKEHDGLPKGDSLAVYLTAAIISLTTVLVAYGPRSVLFR